MDKIRYCCENCKYQNRQNKKCMNEESVNAFNKMENDEACLDWVKISCPFCGGMLSTSRVDDEKFYRHCYNCGFEYYNE